jgi:hypothetical protein
LAAPRLTKIHQITFEEGHSTMVISNQTISHQVLLAEVLLRFRGGPKVLRALAESEHGIGQLRVRKLVDLMLAIGEELSDQTALQILQAWARAGLGELKIKVKGKPKRLILPRGFDVREAARELLKEERAPTPEVTPHPPVEPPPSSVSDKTPLLSQATLTQHDLMRIDVKVDALTRDLAAISRDVSGLCSDMEQVRAVCG